MKVTGSNGMNVARIYSENKPKAAAARDRASKSYDTVEISKEGLEISKYVSIASGLSDIRAGKVEEIKARIAGGTYDISPEKLASSIMKHINDNMYITGIDVSPKED